MFLLKSKRNTWSWVLSKRVSNKVSLFRSSILCEDPLALFKALCSNEIIQIAICLHKKIVVFASVLSHLPVPAVILSVSFFFTRLCSLLLFVVRFRLIFQKRISSYSAQKKGNGINKTWIERYAIFERKRVREKMHTRWLWSQGILYERKMHNKYLFYIYISHIIYSIKNENLPVCRRRFY